MDMHLLTPAYLDRHLDYERQHRRYEKLRHASNDGLMRAMGDRLTYSIEGYTLVIRVHERHIFRPKIFLLDYPDLHEHYSEVIQARQLLVIAPT